MPPSFAALTCQGAVVLTNADGGRQLINEVLRAIADTYRWPDPMLSAERESIAITPAIIERYVGPTDPGTGRTNLSTSPKTASVD